MAHGPGRAHLPCPAFGFGEHVPHPPAAVRSRTISARNAAGPDGPSAKAVVVMGSPSSEGGHRLPAPGGGAEAGPGACGVPDASGTRILWPVRRRACFLGGWGRWWMMRTRHTWSMCASSMLPFFSSTTSKSVSGSCKEGRGSKAQVDHGLPWGSPAGEFVTSPEKTQDCSTPPLPPPTKEHLPFPLFH